MESLFHSHIEYSFTAPFDDGLDTYFTTINGKLMCSDAKSDGEYESGKIEAFYLDLEAAMSARLPPMEIFDLDVDAFSHYEALFNSSTGEVKDEILEEFGPEVHGYNWLILNRLEILPRFRGMKLGLAAMHRTIQQFGKACMFVSLEVAPLQVSDTRMASVEIGWMKEMQMDSFTSDKTEATKRLKSYYGHVGFMAIEGCNLMLLNPAYHQPTLQEIGYE